MWGVSRTATTAESECSGRPGSGTSDMRQRQSARASCRGCSGPLCSREPHAPPLPRSTEAARPPPRPKAWAPPPKKTWPPKRRFPLPVTCCGLFRILPLIHGHQMSASIAHTCAHGDASSRCVPLLLVCPWTWQRCRTITWCVCVACRQWELLNAVSNVACAHRRGAVQARA